MRQRRQPEPAEAGRESAENIGREVDAEVDAREADAEDGQRGERVHDGLRGDGTMRHKMMRDDRIRRRRKERMSARKAVRVRQRDAPCALDRTLALEDV